MTTTFLIVQNNAVSTLASGINNSVTSLDVASGEGALFPSTYPYHITLDDEVMSVTARSTDTLTVVRAQQGTAAASHSADIPVELRITAKSFTDLNTAVNALEAHQIVATEVEVAELGSATYDDVQDWINNTLSAGYVEGGLLTAATGENAGKLNVSEIKGFIKTTNDEIGDTKSFTLVAQSNLDILSAGINFVYVKFIAPSTVEILATATRSDIELNRQFTLGRVYRENNTLHIRQSGMQLANYMRKEHERLYEVRFTERAEGLIISDDGDRSFDLSAGVFYAGRNRIKLESALDTTSDKFTYWKYIGTGDSSAEWQTDTEQTGISHQQYNNVSTPGSEALANLGSNKYGVHWVFLDLDGHLHVLYGQGDYKLTEAQDSMLPSSLPAFLQHFCLLVGRIIKKETVDAFTEIASAYERFFPTTLITDHGELGGLTDPDHDTVYPNKDLFDAANTILKADVQSTPEGLTIAEQRLVGRITSGVITGLTPTQIRTLLNIEDGSTADLTGAEIVTLLEALAAAARLSHNDGLSDLTAGDPHTQYPLKTLWNAHSIIIAISNNTPVVLELAASRMIGRASSGNIVALAKADILTIINVTEGADVTGSNTCDTPGGAGTDSTAIHDNAANEITAITLKGTPAAADEVVLEDSAASYVKKSATVATLGSGIKLDDLATPDDNADLDSSTSRHGLLKKLDNTATNFMNGQGNWSAPAGGASAAQALMYALCS